MAKQLPKQLLFIAFAIMVRLDRPVIADEVPLPEPPDVQTLRLSKDVPGGNVVLSWSDGSAPFSVQRNESPNYATPTNLAYVTRSTTGGPVSDPVLNNGTSYYYLVSDANTPAQVFSIVSAAGTGFFEGEDTIIDGTGFDPICGNNAVYYDDGTAATLMTCSPTQIEAEIPAHAVSGSVTVVTPTGVSTRQTKLLAVGLRSNTLRQAQTHINVDASNNLFVADQTTGFNRIWKINYSSGAASECVTVGNPIGLPRVGSSLYFGTETASAANVGTVREVDVGCGAVVNWGATGTATTDPVWARAMATDPSGNNNDYVFLLDHAGDRIRRRKNNANLDTMWLTGLGLGGASGSDPAGFTFNDAGEFFFTASPSTIQQYNASRAFVQQFTSSDGVNRASQIAFDEAQTLWVANRDGNNVLRIRTNPADRLVRTKLSGIAAPRGIALDRDPVSMKPWLYVADQTQVYRFRVYDTVHFDVKVLNEALRSPSGVLTSKTDFEARVRRDVNIAADIFKQCGVEVIVDRVLFIADPNTATNGGDGSVLRDSTTSLTTQENTLFGTSRSANAFAVNVYYVNHFREPNPVPPPATRTRPTNGVTYTNDFFTTIPSDRTGIIIGRFSTPSGSGGPLSRGAIDSTAAHELGHFLLNNFVNPVGPDEHHGSGCTGPERFYLMHRTGCTTRWTLSTDECTNILTNGDESVFVEQF